MTEEAEVLLIHEIPKNDHVVGHGVTTKRDTVRDAKGSRVMRK